MHHQDGRKAAPRQERRQGFLTRLRKDARGNTLAIVGAALVPLSAMIGSGIDMSRAYMAKARLQSACDSAALAARRVMVEGEMTSAVEAEANRFMNFNFPQGSYQTAAFTPAVTSPDAGIVAISVNTTIPTTIMSMFGFTSLPLEVSCEAELNFVNTDVMLVLDLSTSMNDPLGGSTRIQALRDAVMALYDELAPIQTELEANELRLRYGVVNYSNTVNVGELIRTANANYLVDSAQYQTRVANYNTPVYVPTDTPITSGTGYVAGPGVQRFQTNGNDRSISSANCANFGNNNGFTQGSWTYTAIGANNDNDIYDPDGSAPPQASAPAPPTAYVRYQFSRNTPAWTGNPTDRVCDRNVTVTRRTYTTRYKFTDWSFRQASYDTSQFKNGGSVTIANVISGNPSRVGGSVPTAGLYTLQEIPLVASNVTTVPSADQAPNLTTGTAAGWNGCIEERTTVDSINSSSPLSIPSGALDLNINLIPTDDTNRWRPMWPEMVYYRQAGTQARTSGTQVSGVNAACASPARELGVWTRDQMLTYVTGLTPNGYTFHDIGLLWGARMISNTGIFAANNPDTYNQMPVNRHIIFMTDGVMQTGGNNDATAYSPYGIDQNDRRILASGVTANRGNLDPIHIRRFRMICESAKSMGVQIWVIAFGTSLTTDLTACASSPGQAKTSADRDTLISQFREIGSNIGALRLTQ